jgi:dTDP-4-dehydrorhamnose reductase
MTHSTGRKRLLITGASGLLGYWLCHHFSKRYEVTGLCHSHPIGVSGISEIEIDLQERTSLKAVFENALPDIVIHAAGLTDVDKCETHPDLARALNVDLTEEVGELCANMSAKLVHISTDHLFDGSQSFATEITHPKPINEYARTKLQAEASALKSPQALVLRTNFFGPGRPWRTSFSDWVTRTLLAGEKLTLFHDVYITPLAMAHLCPIIEQLIFREATDIYNVVGSERISKLNLGLRIAKRFGLDTRLIKGVSVDEASLNAPRPKDMSLSSTKLSSLLGAPLPDVAAGVAILSPDITIKDIRS